ncbi:MAG TPA: hypothetical protein VF316_16770 [Polyangiaceae bacterium]
MRRLLTIVACALVACGDSSSNGGDGKDGSIDAPSADAGPSADASELDSAVVSTDSGDAGLRQATPPAGWAMCGTGAITEADALAACNEIGASPKNCDTVTVSGGKWTVWCDPGKAIYVWATIDGLSQTTATSCAGSVPFVDHVSSAFDISGGGVGGGGTVFQPTTPPPRSSSAEYELQRPTTATSGQGTLVIGARLAVGVGCALTNDPTGNLVTGFHIQWQ